MMDYDWAMDTLDQVKRFAREQVKTLDGRKKSHRLAHEQLKDLYRVCCVAKNHVRVARRSQFGDMDEI